MWELGAQAPTVPSVSMVINHSAILCIGSKLTPSAQYLLCVQTSGESWCLDECCALIKASAGSPDNSTSTLKGVCK